MPGGAGDLLDLLDGGAAAAPAPASGGAGGGGGGAIMRAEPQRGLRNAFRGLG